MRAILFCYNPYAFGILKPLYDELIREDHSVLWYLRPGLESKFPYINNVLWTNTIADLIAFKSDAIFVPGNEVPHSLRGVKVQVFHGLAGEKKGHFRIRHYFDLYLTQGPYFTKGFQDLARKHRNFEVVETGWPKLDPMYLSQLDFMNEKEHFLNKCNAKKIVLYAPTFSPSLTSAPFLFDEIEKIASSDDLMVLIKFHDLMDKDLKHQYRQRFENHKSVEFADDPNILKYLIIADLMISDTSSVIYEFMLLNKPVITFRTISKNILWNDLGKANVLFDTVLNTLKHDDFEENRKKIINSYHPYTDGESSKRVIRAVEDYIDKKGVPESRKLSLYRRWKLKKIFSIM